MKGVDTPLGGAPPPRWQLPAAAPPSSSSTCGLSPSRTLGTTYERIVCASTYHSQDRLADRLRLLAFYVPCYTMGACMPMIDLCSFVFSSLQVLCARLPVRDTQVPTVARSAATPTRFVFSVSN